MIWRKNFNFMFTTGNVNDREPLKQGKFPKNIVQVKHLLHRSFSNFIVNSLSAIAAYCLFEKKPVLNSH